MSRTLRTRRSLRPRRSLAAAALAPLLLAGLAGCGDGGGSPSQAHDSSAAAPAAAGLQAGDRVDTADFVKTISDGLAASTTAHMAMKMSSGAAGGMTAEGDLDYTSTPPSVAMTMTMPTVSTDTLDLRMVDGIMYLSMGQLTSGKFWKIDPSDPNGPMAALGMDKLMDQMNPAKALEAAGDGIRTVTYAGDEDELHHYTVTVDTKKMLAAMGSGLPAQLGAQVPSDLTYDVWLDDQDRFSKMRMDDLPTGSATGTLEITITDWGKNVDIKAPPAGEVTPMPDLGSMSSPSPAA